MDIPTIPGAWYTVATATTCEITDTATGTPLGTAESGSYTFQAQGSLTTLSDDSALYSKSTFKSAPAKLMALGLLGGGESAFKKLTLEEALALANLPEGGGELSVSLPWEAQLIVYGVPDALQTAKSKGWTITVQYRKPEANSAVYNKYANCVAQDDMQEVNPDYKSDLTAEGEWIYPLPKLKNARTAFHWAGKVKKWGVDLPALVDGSWMYIEVPFSEYSAALPLLENGESMFRNKKGSFVFSSALPHLKNGFAMFSTTNKTVWLSLSFESALPVLEDGQAMFDGNILDVASVLRVSNSIPSYTAGTHRMTLGVHVDHQTDDDVLAALEEIESKGWTLTVQWNGTATAQSASTFGLRKPPIYAKLGNIERPDGTTEQFLDWGHYVTDCEANGYMEFASVEDANAFFGIDEELLTAYNENE